MTIRYSPGQPVHIVVHNDHNHAIRCNVKVDREHKHALKVNPTKFTLKTGDRQLVRFCPAESATEPIKVKVSHHVNGIDNHVSSSKYLLTPVL